MAKAEIKNAQGVVLGTATFRPAEGGVRMSIRLSGLPPGEHAVHIHEAARCEPPDFKTAGGHFNPLHKQHGKENSAGAHLGDLPNFTADPRGQATASFLVPGVNMGTEDVGLFHGAGTSVVIHAGPDDYKTDPAGNSGARIACGIVVH